MHSAGVKRLLSLICRVCLRLILTFLGTNWPRVAKNCLEHKGAAGCQTTKTRRVDQVRMM
jgi:hypothetical protein